MKNVFCVAADTFYPHKHNYNMNMTDTQMNWRYRVREHSQRYMYVARLQSTNRAQIYSIYVYEIRSMYDACKIANSYDLEQRTEIVAKRCSKSFSMYMN